MSIYIRKFEKGKLLDDTAILFRLPHYRRKISIPKEFVENFSLYDAALKHIFSDGTTDARQRYEYLFRYLLTGFLSCRDKIPSLVHYFGLPSFYDKRVQAMEGYSRFLPLICAWLSGGHPSQVRTLKGEFVDLAEIIRTGLLSGTDPASAGYWGDMADYDQRICESALLSLAIRLMPTDVWDKFSKKEKKLIFNYILKSNGKKITDNNWNMFPVWINKVAASLGFDHDDQEIETHFDRIRSFYRGEGWFTDGQPQGKDRFDYYNVFVFHLFLYLLTVFEPDFEAKFIREALGQFLEKYPYFLTPAGVPFLGRSIPYRMALTAPVIAGCQLDPDRIAPGMARRSFDTIMKHFITRGAFARGTVTQGYYQEDFRWLDSYIGPASGLFSLIGVMLALRIPFDEPFWTEPELPLPVEKKDFRFDIKSVNWEIRGYQRNCEVIIMPKNNNLKKIKYSNYTILHLLAERFFRKPFRPNNRSAKYDQVFFTSRNPVWG